ncbi:class I SAM-dependent methyltransferase [Cerasibacillus terrae]|uniref:class I SAM-dependent methyltransferase n=1 Tax=Cerasibacillus terrae TaxID=2498845 RepID=UPI001E4CD605|nr:class I SAM-dependent methyltransferase [Cerasibacillus terrae]
MPKINNVENLYSWLDATANILEKHREEPYLECLAQAMDLLFFQEVPTSGNEILDNKLQKALNEIQPIHFEQLEIRKAVQLAILKGMKDATQQQHLMTPEAVALFTGYVAEKLMGNKEKTTIFDPACGTSNLLTTVISQFNHKVEAYGNDIDPTLIQLSLASANLQKMDIEFFKQDSMRPFLIDPVDLVVSDLPVGYYPDDVRASEFELKADDGQSYAHHLLIEQSLMYTKEAGYLIFLIPNFLFTSDQAEKLHQFLREHAHIVGLLQLPESIFKTDKNTKSILVLQKKGEHTSTPKQPLLVQLPSFKNEAAMADIVKQMNQWFLENISEK